MSTIRIGLLGGVAISGTDAPLPSRAVALLGYLVTRTGSPQPRGHLAGLLWPESTGTQARTNLRRELHHLRAAVDASGSLEVTSSSLVWHESQGAEVDVCTFLRARREALDRLANSGAGFATAADRALDSYGGVFLPGCYDEWALTSREELQAACVDLCDRAAAYHEEHGDVQAAIALEVRRVALQPLEEQGYQRLMRLQRLAGDRAGAMRTFHRCASVLEQELGVPPAPETQREVDALLADATALPDRAGIGGATKPMGPGAPDLVGREREQRRLRELWSTSTGSSRLVLVTGEAGIGKTRLVADLAAAVTRGGGVVASARCFAATSGLPLAPVAEWLRSRHLRLSASRLEPLWRAEVERLVPDSGVEPREPGHSSRAMVDAWQRLRFFEGMARAVLTVDRPLLLVVDDLQWCDNATLSWISFLLSYPTTAPLMVVGTAREEELNAGRWPDSRKSMEAAGQVVTVRLGPLSTSATAELTTYVVDQPLSEEQVGLVQSVTGGNPFYVIEALREANASPGPVKPDDLRGVLNSRFARLSEPALQVLGLAAAVGRDFDLRAADRGVRPRVRHRGGPDRRAVACASPGPGRRWLRLHPQPAARSGVRRRGAGAPVAAAPSPRAGASSRSGVAAPTMSTPSSRSSTTAAGRRRERSRSMTAPRGMRPRCSRIPSRCGCGNAAGADGGDPGGTGARRA